MFFGRRRRGVGFSLVILLFLSGICVARLSPHPQGITPDLKDPRLIAEGDQVFAQSCSIAYCHGREGAAGRAPSVRDKKWVVPQLRKVILEGIPNTSMPNWDDKLSEGQLWAVVAYILSISGEAPAPGPSPLPAPAGRGTEPGPAAASLPESLVGDPGRGEELFFAVAGERGCAGCHALDGKGNSVGPDLSGSARKDSRAVFRDILFPGASIAPGQQLLRVTMKDGETISGLKREETPAAVRLYDTASMPPALRRLPKDQIQNVEVTPQSAMPARYGEIYTLRELLDLVSFLKSSGAAAPVRISLLDIQ